MNKAKRLAAERARTKALLDRLGYTKAKAQPRLAPRKADFLQPHKTDT